MQHQRAVFAEEFDAVAGAEIRRATHRQAASGPASSCSAIATVVSQFAVARQPDDARRQARDRPAEPFEIMEAMADEISQHAAAVAAADVFQLRMRIWMARLSTCQCTAT